MATTAAFTFSLSLLTWNTYFAPHRWADRMAGILQTCAAIQPHSPHVIYLQEVLPQFLLLPGWDAWLDRHGYVSSATDPADLAPYGVMTLAKRHLSSHFEEVPLPSRMGRRLLIAHLRDAASGRQWRVGNVHLESMDSAPSRREQLAVAGRVMGGGRGDESSIIGGDFNFDADRNYDVRPGVPLEVSDRRSVERLGWL